MSPPPIKASGPVSNDNIQYCVQNNYSSVDFLEVSNLYDFLNEEGFFTGKTEAYMTTSLKFAIKNFQRFVGIRVDGIIGPSTHKAMTSFNNCTKTVEAELIECSGYLAYKECAFFVSSKSSLVTTTTVTTTTVPSPVCDDETFKPYGITEQSDKN